MPLHPNVKLAPKGLETLVSRIESGCSVDVAACQMGVSCQAACPQQARQGFSDCDSRPCIYSTAAAGAPSEGARTPTGRSSAGPSCLHVATGDFSRVAYAELLPDERKGTCVASMARCLHFIERHNWECPHSACGAALLCRASSA